MCTKNPADAPVHTQPHRPGTTLLPLPTEPAQATRTGGTCTAKHAPRARPGRARSIHCQTTASAKRPPGNNPHQPNGRQTLRTARKARHQATTSQHAQRNPSTQQLVNHCLQQHPRPRTCRRTQRQPPKPRRHQVTTTPKCIHGQPAKQRGNWHPNTHETPRTPPATPRTSKQALMPAPTTIPAPTSPTPRHLLSADGQKQVTPAPTSAANRADSPPTKTPGRPCLVQPTPMPTDIQH